MKRVGTALILALAVSATTPAHGSEGVVLAVRPDGVVIDASALPALQPGSRVGFLRPDPQRTQTGQGFVLDLQAGQALVGIVPGTGVRVNDLVVMCPPRGPAANDQVRSLVDGIRAQGAAPQVLQTAGQLQSVLDARDAAIQQGSCDVARFDEEVQALLAQLQNDAALAQAAPSAATGYPPAGTTASGSPATGGYPVAGTSGSAYPPATGGATYPAPGAPTLDTGTPAGAVQGGTASGSSSQSGDVIDSAARGVDVLAKLALIAQTLGVSVRGAQQGPGGGTPPAAGGFPPATGSGPSVGDPPPSAGGSGIPPSGGIVPPSAGGSPAGGSSSAGGSPAGGSPSGAGGSQAGGPQGGTGTGTSGASRPTWPVIQVPSAGGRRQVALIPKATVAGRVQTPAGQPLAAAQITVGDARGQTDAQGHFTVAGLAPGQYTVTVTVIGYQRQTRTVTLDAGETERLVVVMPRLSLIAPNRVVPKSP